MTKRFTRQAAYALDFGLSYNFPFSYWKDHYRTLAKYGYNTVMLWISGCAPVKGFEKTCEWKCEYVPELVSFIQSLGMKAYLMSGLFNWMGMSPGFIRMDPSLAATWPEKLKTAYPPESQRHALCSTKSYLHALEYFKGLWRLCPQADGFAVEVGCEKPHCTCKQCTDRGHWRIETDFLNEFSKWLWQQNPRAEIIWNLGYARTHGLPPESRLYEEAARRKDPRLIWWYVRPKTEYMDEGGRKWHFDNPGTIERIGTNGIMHHLPDVPVGETALLAQSCNLTGISGHPDERHLFLPEQRAEDSGYLRLAGPPSPPTCKHWLFKLRALHYHFAFNNPGAGEDEYARYVRKEFDCDDKELIETMVLMENIIIDRRALAHRSSKNLYLAKDGLTGEQVSPALEPDETAVLRTFAEQSQKFSSLGEEVRHTILKLNFQ